MQAEKQINVEYKRAARMILDTVIDVSGHNMSTEGALAINPSVKSGQDGAKSGRLSAWAVHHKPFTSLSFAGPPIKISWESANK